jgi:antitoxin Phd
MSRWSIREARNRFGALLKAAREDGPQIVTKNGEPAVVVLSSEQHARLRRLEDGFAAHLLAMPTGGDLERLAGHMRDRGL